MSLYNDRLLVFITKYIILYRNIIDNQHIYLCLFGSKYRGKRATIFHKKYPENIK